MILLFLASVSRQAQHGRGRCLSSVLCYFLRYLLVYAFPFFYHCQNHLCICICMYVYVRVFYMCMIDSLATRSETNSKETNSRTTISRRLS